MQLLPVVNTPNIVTAVPTAPSCGNISDGKIKITLSRALYSSETLSLSVLFNGNTTVKTITPAQAPGGVYAI